MSASGKSSNRHSEYLRGKYSGTGHGIYAADGIRDRQKSEKEKTETPEDKDK